MERPWLILERVLRIAPPGYDYDAIGGAQAEEDAQAQEVQHAAAMDMDAAMGAQDEQQAAEEEDPDPQAQAQLEESVVNVNTRAAAAHAAHGAGEPAFTIVVARPPRISPVVAGARSHPDTDRPDMFPYIVASGRFCLLAHFAMKPYVGTNFSEYPDHSHLVVARHFRRTGDDDDGQIAACIVRVPDRPDDDFDIPALRNIDSVGLVCDQATGHYQIAELVVAAGDPDEVAVIYIRTDTGLWQGNYMVNLLLKVDPRRDWVPHGTVTIGSTVFWFDLSWGIISCDLALPDPDQLHVLTFHRLPPGRVLRAGSGAMPDIHSWRCIAVSENLVRYVEITAHLHRVATVSMWYRDMAEGNPHPPRWVSNFYEQSFAGIWDDESYAQTGLPRNIPDLVGVSPVDSNVVYISLNHRLFGVNVPEHRVVDCEEYEPLDRPGQLDEPVTSRYLMAWNLDGDGEINVGHQQDEHIDHGDSSGSGTVDEGDIDSEHIHSSSGSGTMDGGDMDYQSPTE